jgi:hypothetical protein
MDTNQQSEMPPRFGNLVWRIFLSCGLAGLAVVAIYLIVETHKLGRRDPIYQKKRLSSWMVEANSGSWPRQSLVPADEAIRQIGTNAFPMVARLLRSHDSALKSKLLALYYRQSFIRIHIRSQYDHHSCALAACWALGSEAKPLVPTVAKALNHMDPYFRPAFQLWLQQLGSDADAAVPALITLLKDKKNPTRDFVPQTLGRISMQRRREVIPVLTACLQDTNPMVRFWAEDALKDLGAPQQTTATKTP